jgi:hypothetical protein
MSEQANAWILGLGEHLYAAIGEREMVHLIDEPELVTLPDNPSWCNQAVLWQGEVLTVMNLLPLLTSSPGSSVPDTPVVGVVAYQSEPGGVPQYGGVLLNHIPIKKPVTNEQACDLPEPQQEWQQLAVACFADNGRATPVLDLPRLFAEVPETRAGQGWTK